MSARFGILSGLVLAAGFAFLYGPIALLVLYSFNASELVTVWGGFSTRWYSAVFANAQLRDAALASMLVAMSSATLAAIFGTLAAIALVRFGRFRGRLAFSALVFAPVIMPEIVTGLSLLLLFVAIDLDRGFATVALAHASFTTGFVAVVVQSRLVTFDRALEDAAADLGCPPWKTFLVITLPLIAPAVAAGWLLAFTLSLDDLVVANFTNGPGTATLPIRVYAQVRRGVRPEINALSTLMISAVTLLAIAFALAAKWRARR